MFGRERLIKTTAEGEKIFGEARPENNEELTRQQSIDEAAQFQKRLGNEPKEKEKEAETSSRPENIDELMREAVQRDFDQAEAMKKAIKNPTTNPKG